MEKKNDEFIIIYIVVDSIDSISRRFVVMFVVGRPMQNNFFYHPIHFLLAGEPVAATSSS